MDLYLLVWTQHFTVYLIIMTIVHLIKLVRTRITEDIGSESKSIKETWLTLQWITELSLPREFIPARENPGRQRQERQHQELAAYSRPYSV